MVNYELCLVAYGWWVGNGPSTSLIYHGRPLSNLVTGLDEQEEQLTTPASRAARQMSL